MLDLEHCPVVITSADGMHYCPVVTMKTGPRRSGCCSRWLRLTRCPWGCRTAGTSSAGVLNDCYMT